MSVLCFFASDLHGRVTRYTALFDAVERQRPAAVFLGGDLLPHGYGRGVAPSGPAVDFLTEVLVGGLERLRHRLSGARPRVFVILGNDDPRAVEPALGEAEQAGLCEYVHGRRVEWQGRAVYGYACVPPTPFTLKDWERYDVSRYVDPGCTAPEEGRHTVAVEPRVLQHATIAGELDALAGDADQSGAVWLFHSPPYGTSLDRAALDGRAVEHVPLDVHVGSMAIRRFIEARQPAVTLHGHVHESARLTGGWRTRLGRTQCFSAAHDGPELALVAFDPGNPDGANRLLL
jgi:Icc-related predicted phosphoesterase